MEDGNLDAMLAPTPYGAARADPAHGAGTGCLGMPAGGSTDAAVPLKGKGKGKGKSKGDQYELPPFPKPKKKSQKKPCRDYKYLV